MTAKEKLAAQENEDAVKYLKDFYGLEPGDVDLKESDTIEDIDRIAKKYGLTKVTEMTIEKAEQVLRRFRGD